MSLFPTGRGDIIILPGGGVVLTPWFFEKKILTLNHNNIREYNPGHDNI